MTVDPRLFAPFDMAGSYAQGQQFRAAEEDRKFRLGDLMQRQQQQERENAQQRVARTAPYAARARQLPADQRRAFMEQARPSLRALGWSDEELNGFDLTNDAALEALAAGGQTVEQINQQGQAVDWVTIPGVGVLPTDPRTRLPIDIGARMQGQVSAQPQPAPASPPGTPQAQAPPTATPTASYATGVASTLAAGGLPAPVIAGILANGHYESGGWNISNSGDQGTAHGAFQWRNERADNFRRITGADPRSATPEQTAQFVMWELQNPEQAGMTREQAQAILSARTPQEAALLFSRHYERPNARMANNGRRVALAAQYAQGAAGAPASAPVASDQGQGSSLFRQLDPYIIRAPPQPPAGYRANPDGTFSAIPGGPGDRTYERGRDTQTDARAARQEIGTVLQQFRSDPDVRAWRQARTSALQMRTLGRSGTAADDMAMIFSFMKVLDPASTVREGEFAQAQDTAGIPDRIRNYYNRAQTGNRLNPNQRADMIRTAERLYAERSGVYNELAQNYRDQLLAMDVPPAQVGRMVQLARAGQSRGGQAQQPRRAGRTSTGVRWRVVQ